MGYRNHKKFNTYDFVDDYVIGHTDKTENFYFDKNDYELVTKDNRYWYIEEGYVRFRYRIKNGRVRISMHNLIMGLKNIGKVDHINGMRNDNRRKNLRLANKSQNAINSGIPRNNTSGAKGIKKYFNKWIVNIGRNYLGLYNSFYDAINARKNAEIEIYGEYSPLKEK